MLQMNKLNQTLQKAISISSTILGSLFFFGLIGYFLSKKFDNELWLIYLLIIGAFIGLYELYKQIKK